MNKSRDNVRHLMQTIAQRIKSIRTSAGLTQEQLAEKTGIAPQYLSRLETARQLPSLETLIEVADALGCTPSLLLCEPHTDAQEERVSRISALLSTLNEEDAVFLETQLGDWMRHLRETRKQN